METKKINARISKEEIIKAYECLKHSGTHFIFQDVEHITKKEMKTINKQVMKGSF